MDAGVLWTIIGVAVAIVFGLWGLYAFYQDHPRRRLEYYVTRQRLISDNWSADALDVFYKGVRLDDPWLVEFHFFSNSRAEIGSGLFDQNRPVAFVVLSLSVLVSDPTQGAGLTVTGVRNLWPTATVIELGPQKIERGATLYVAILSAGDPTIKMAQSPFPDKIKIKLVAPPELRSSWRIELRAFFAVLASIVGGIGIGVLVLALLAAIFRWLTP